MKEQVKEGFGLDKVTKEPYVYDYTQKKKRFDLDALGYHKSMQLRVIGVKKKFHKKVSEDLFEETYSYTYQLWNVKVESCPYCQTQEISNCYLMRQSLRTPCFRKCFATKITTLWFDFDNKKHFKLVTERPIDLKEIAELLKKGAVDYIADDKLIEELESHFDTKY
jgi:hypothetical protein